MATEIGNDELILHFRKQHPECVAANSQLGKRIWQWIRTNDPTATKVRRRSSAWRESRALPSSSPRPLPKRATQFSVDPAILPDLYRFLDGLADTTHTGHNQRS
jgi:hypothetical protein